MKKKELEKKVKELELLVREQKDEIATLKLELENQKYVPHYPFPNDKNDPLAPPFIVKDGVDDGCIDGEGHDYPLVWHGIIPPACKKCGKQGNMLNITWMDTGNLPWDINEHGGNIVDGNPHMKMDYPNHYFDSGGIHNNL